MISNLSVAAHPGPPDIWKSRTSYASVIILLSATFAMSIPPPGISQICEPGESGFAGWIEATSNFCWANEGTIDKMVRIARVSMSGAVSSYAGTALSVHSAMIIAA